MAARDALSNKIAGKKVTVRSVDMKKDDEQILGIVYLDGCINTEMVREGWAWYCPTSQKSATLKATEKQAREGKRGLWKHPNPLSPWEWRRLCKTDGVTGVDQYKVIEEHPAAIGGQRFLRVTYKVVVPSDISESLLSSCFSNQERGILAGGRSLV